MDAQDCEAAAEPETPASGFVATWWDMVLRNLRSCPYSCSALGRKSAALCRSFTSKSLKEHIFPPLMDMLIYFNFYKAPFLVDLKKPELKIAHTVNFYLRPEPRVLLGIWHTVPSCRGEEAKGKDRCWYNAALNDGNPIVVYLHGSAEHRGAPHRIKLAKVLSDGGFHVLSVDYRGFGDSTGKPTEEGLTVDAICVYEWTKARSGNTPVCLWGHSLGTGVATNAAKALEEKGCPVDAIVLEAPFTNMWVASINYPLLKVRQTWNSLSNPGWLGAHGDHHTSVFPLDCLDFSALEEGFWVADIHHPAQPPKRDWLDRLLLQPYLPEEPANNISAKIYQKLPRCLRTLMDALKKDKIVFASDENVKCLSSPLLILHGEDDRTVPLECGKQLYEIARKAYRNKDRVKMVIFPPGFHHNLLCQSPLLLSSVREFLSQQWA